MALLIQAACSQPPAGRTVHATINDFRVHLPSPTLEGGLTSFVVYDRGPSTHEFVVVRTALASDRLPLQANGLSVDEGSPLLSPVGSLDVVELDQTVTLTVRLSPGRYVIFCNFEGHYLGGMHAAFRVGPPAG